MNLFPFDQPAATAFYLVLYALTLASHVVFLSYVLAGSAWLAFRGVFRGDGSDGSALTVLRDWMPFALSAAITTAIAPLLFVQILYRESFYTANLLLFHRWMAIVPVLIVAFYLLYVLKAKRLPSWARRVIGLVIFGCFGFTAWSWTENHVLSLAGQEAWASQYVSGELFFRSAEILPRLGMWFGGAFVVMAPLVAWQVRRERSRGLWRRLALTSFAGLVVAAGLFAAQPTSRSLPWSSDVLVYTVVGGVGLLLTILAWALVLRRGEATSVRLGAASLGVTLMIVAACFVREYGRVTRLDIESQYALHERAREVKGFGVFVLFLVINAILIGWALRIASNARGKGEASEVLAGEVPSADEQNERLESE